MNIDRLLKISLAPREGGGFPVARGERFMWLVLLGRTISDNNGRSLFHVQFRKARDARRFAQALALVLMRYVLRPWKVAVYRVDPDCWPEDFASPIVQWSCQ